MLIGCFFLIAKENKMCHCIFFLLCFWVTHLALLPSSSFCVQFFFSWSIFAMFSHAPKRSSGSSSSECLAELCFKLFIAREIWVWMHFVKNSGPCSRYYYKWRLWLEYHAKQRQAEGCYSWESDMYSLKSRMHCLCVGGLLAPLESYISDSCNQSIVASNRRLCSSVVFFPYFYSYVPCVIHTKIYLIKCP